MSTAISSSSALGHRSEGVYRARRSFDSARGLAAMLLAAAVAAMVVLADHLISTWADGHLFLAWVSLWVVVFAGLALFGSTARSLALRTLKALDGWSRSLAEARAEARLWELAKQDPRLRSELIQARIRESAEVDAAAVAPVAKSAEVFSEALAPMGLDSGVASPVNARQMAQTAMRRHAGYLPYL